MKILVSCSRIAEVPHKTGHSVCKEGGQPLNNSNNNL